MDKVKVIDLYDGEVRICYEDRRHRYTLGTPDGEQIRGVSSALDAVSKPLHRWSVRVAMDRIKEAFANLTQISRASLEEILKNASSEHERVKNAAAESGTSVHKLVELHILGKDVSNLPTSDIEAAKFREFLRFIDEHQPVFHDTERVVYSRKYKYVGTLDFTVTINGKKYVGDLKTGTAIRDSYFMQTAAYQHALEEETGERYDGRVIVLVSWDKKLGVPGLTVCFRDNDTYRTDFLAFMSAKFLSEWIDKHEWDDDDLLTIENLLGM